MISRWGYQNYGIEAQATDDLIAKARELQESNDFGKKRI